MEEEITELKQAIDENDFIECIDAVCDMMYFVYGSFHVMGVEFNNFPQQPYQTYTRIKNNPNIFTDDRKKLMKLVSLLDKNIKNMKYVLSHSTDSEISVKNMLYKEQIFYNLVQYFENIESIGRTMGSLFGVDIDACFKEVHRSNMTKICKTEEEARKTVENYQNNPKNIYDPAYRYHEPYWVVYNKKDLKIIKSMYWELPNLAKVCEFNC